MSRKGITARTVFTVLWAAMMLGQLWRFHEWAFRQDCYKAFRYGAAPAACARLMEHWPRQPGAIYNSDLYKDGRPR